MVDALYRGYAFLTVILPSCTCLGTLTGQSQNIKSEKRLINKTNKPRNKTDATAHNTQIDSVFPLKLIYKRKFISAN